MSLFKKPNRKFRQREVQSESEESEDEEDTPIPPKSKAKPEPISVHKVNPTPVHTVVERAEVPQAPKPPMLLSFEEDEDENETFKLKKSNYSRRLIKQREKERRKKEELSHQTTNKPSSKKDDVEEKFSFKAFHKKMEQRKDEVFAGDEAEDMDVDSDEEKNNPFKGFLQSGVIPDAKTIYAMKKHRQMAREMGEFIPLDDGEKDDEKSRLIRDDDNDRSDDDEPSRINFTVDTEAVEKQKMRETFMSLQESSTNELENEDADELERWEREQIKKGVGLAQVGNLDSSHTENQYYPFSQNDMMYASSNVEKVRSQSIPATALKRNGTHLTTKDIKLRLQERLEALKSQHKAHVEEYENCNKALVETADEIEKLTTEAPVLAQNFKLYQHMCSYVKDLVSCMDLKVAHIDLLEGKMIDLYKARSQRLAARRQSDLKDQSDEFAAISCQMSKGINVEFLADKAFGNDEVKKRRAAEREGRRMRRRKQRERQGMGTSLKHQDGMSSDDEETDVDIVHFKEAKQNILQEAQTILEDVNEDFGTLEGVMLNFENWKSNQLVSYCEAYVPLCLPKIFGVFVKLALLNWNPLLEKREFEKCNWFNQLVQYGLHYDQDYSNEDPDLNLLPGIMEKVVLPKLTAFAQNVWNPLSSSETSKLVDLVKYLLENYPTISGKSKQLQTFLKTAAMKMHESLNSDVFIPLYPKELLECRSVAAYDFFQRQFWSAVKLMQNILLWEGIIAEQPLQQMVLGLLLNRYLLMALTTAISFRETLEKCKPIINSIPKHWIKKSKGLPQLKQLVTFLLRFADTQSTAVAKRSSTEDDKNLVKEVVQLLVNIEAVDDAVSLAKKYSISAFKDRNS